MLISRKLQVSLTTEEVLKAIAEYIQREQGHQLPTRYSVECSALEMEGSPEDFCVVLTEIEGELPVLAYQLTFNDEDIPF